MTKKAVKRRKSGTLYLRDRNASYKYNLTDENGCKKEVYQHFFLRTLDFSYHKIIQTICAKSENGNLPYANQRGKSVPSNKTDETQLKDIDAHIMSYDPSISHYRRSHVPNRLYLPSELSIVQMHKNYKNGGGKCSHEIYRRRINLKNIAFTKLGHEECEVCLDENHVCDQENDDAVEDILIQIISKIESKDEKKHTPKTKTSKTASGQSPPRQSPPDIRPRIIAP